MSHLYVQITLPDGKKLSFYDDASYLRNDIDQRRIIEHAIQRRGGRASVPSGYRLTAHAAAVA